MSDQPEAPQPTVKERLTAHMVGYPFSLIPWPHRVLHDAVAEIEALKAERDALRDALQNVMGILSKAESNASGNPEWDYVHSCVDAARAALKARELKL